MLSTTITAQLNSRQEDFWLWIYLECVKNYRITMSNKDISKKTDIPESTVEKYLKKFDDLKLITRENERAKNIYTDRWETISRVIKLNDETFDPFMIEKERQRNIEAALELLELPIAQIERIKRARSKKESVHAKS